MLGQLGIGMGQQARHKALSAIPLPPFDPEAGLSLTGVFDVGGITDPLTAYLTSDMVFAADAVLPSTPANGVLFEHGGGETGHIVLLRDGGHTLRVRAGDGASPYDTNSTAVLDVTNFPQDDQLHNLVWDIRVSGPGRVRLWIDGILAGEAFTTGGSLENGQWSGGGTGNFATGANSNIYGEIWVVPWPAAVTGQLRMYAGQLVAV